MDRLKFLVSSSSFLRYIREVEFKSPDVDILNFYRKGEALIVKECAEVGIAVVGRFSGDEQFFQVPKEDLSRIIRFLASFSDTPILVIPYDGHLMFSDIMI
jgi:hypothetical protein